MVYSNEQLTTPLISNYQSTQNQMEWTNTHLCTYGFYHELIFYQLIHILHLNKATSIYDVGCGTGQLISYIITLKINNLSIELLISHKND